MPSGTHPKAYRDDERAEMNMSLARRRKRCAKDRFFDRIKEIIEEYHRGLKPAGFVAEVIAAVRRVDREGRD